MRRLLQLRWMNCCIAIIGLLLGLIWTIDTVHAADEDGSDDPPVIALVSDGETIPALPWHQSVTAIGEIAYFIAALPPGDEVFGPLMLWRTDGTEASTYPIYTFGDEARSIRIIGKHQDELVITLRSDSSQHELWFSDGTPENTRRIHRQAKAESPGGLVSTSGSTSLTTIRRVGQRSGRSVCGAQMEILLQTNCSKFLA